MANTCSPLGTPAASPATRSDDIEAMAHHDFPAIMSMQDVDGYEADNRLMWGEKRRLTLATLTRTKAELVAGFGRDDNGADVLMEMIEHVQAWKSHLQSAVELADTASARLIVTCATLLQRSESEYAKGLARSNGGAL